MKKLLLLVGRCYSKIILHNHNSDFLEETQISPPVKYKQY